MYIPHILKLKFDDISVYVSKIDDNVKSTLQNYCNSKGFAFCCRIKNIESVLGKLETGRFHSLLDLDDFWAASIIIPNRIFENEVIEYIKKIYTVDVIRKRNGTNKSPETFRFDLTRIICRIPKQSGNPEGLINRIKFEIQIRTAFEHAFCVTTHKLSFKSELVDWKIKRLSAQIKASVEQLDTIIVGAKEIYQFIDSNKDSKFDLQKKVFDFLLINLNEHLIPKDCLPEHMNRFCENIINLISNGKHDNEIEKRLNKSLEILKSEISTICSDEYPKSLTLYQLILMILFKHNLILDFESKSFLISDELISFFPKIKDIKNPIRFLW